MKNKTRWIADAIIGILTATSTVWVDVTIWHRLIIGVTIAFAMQTLFTWLDNVLDGDDIAELERKEENRRKIYEMWREEAP